MSPDDETPELAMRDLSKLSEEEIGAIAEQLAALIIAASPDPDDDKAPDGA
jgi:hypothetical protein